MRVKTRELTGTALDWAVEWAKNPTGPTGEGWFERDENGLLFDPLNERTVSASTIWSQGGPIIDREGINTFRYNKLNQSEPDIWCGHKVVPRPNVEGSTNMVAIAIDGPSLRVAGLRCYVACVLGDEVDVPDEFCKEQQ